MGEKDAAKSGGDEKKGDAGKKEEGPTTVVLKLDLHCEGCAKKVRKAVRYFDGVEDVKTDIGSNKLTVIGKVDPAKVKARVEDKTHKKVEIISPQPKKDGGAAAGGGGGDKKPDAKKADDKKADDKKPKESTVVLKIPVHCEGCKHKIKRAIRKIKGVDSLTIDDQKSLFTVKGTMDAKELVPYLKEKLKQNVEVIPPKKEEGGGEKKEKESGGDKKEKAAAGGGGEKKDGGGGDGKKSEEAKVEVNKMEHYGYSPYSYFTAPMPSQGYMHQGYMDQGYGVPVYNQGYINPGYNQGYMVEYSHPPPPPPPPSYAHDPNMFSDENPNACSIM